MFFLIYLHFPITEWFGLPVSQTVDHCTDNTKVKGLILKESKNLLNVSSECSLSCFVKCIHANIDTNKERHILLLNTFVVCLQIEFKLLQD